MSSYRISKLFRLRIAEMFVFILKNLQKQDSKSFQSYAEGILIHIQATTTHWTYWLQIHSKLCFQRVALSGNYEIVAISIDKNTFLMTLIIKLTLGNIFIKVKKSARGRHRHQIIKTNLKTHISLLLTRPQGSQGCQKMRQDPLNMSVEVLCAKIAPKVNNI